MGDVVQIVEHKDSVVSVLRNALDSAERGELECVFMSMLDKDGTMTYSRAGYLPTGEDCLKMIGSLETQKASLVQNISED